MKGPERDDDCPICGKPLLDTDACYIAHPRGVVHWACHEGERRAKADKYAADVRMITRFMAVNRGAPGFPEAVAALGRVLQEDPKRMKEWLR